MPHVSLSAPATKVAGEKPQETAAVDDQHHEAGDCEMLDDPGADVAGDASEVLAGAAQDPDLSGLIEAGMALRAETSLGPVAIVAGPASSSSSSALAAAPPPPPPQQLEIVVPTDERTRARTRTGQGPCAATARSRHPKTRTHGPFTITWREDAQSFSVHCPLHSNVSEHCTKGLSLSKCAGALDPEDECVRRLRAWCNLASAPLIDNNLMHNGQPVPHLTSRDTQELGSNNSLTYGKLHSMRFAEPWKGRSL
jgi:hypothetical protein